MKAFFAGFSLLFVLGCGTDSSKSASEDFPEPASFEDIHVATKKRSATKYDILIRTKKQLNRQWHITQTQEYSNVPSGCDIDKIQVEKTCYATNFSGKIFRRMDSDETEDCYRAQPAKNFLIKNELILPAACEKISIKWTAISVSFGVLVN